MLSIRNIKIKNRLLLIFAAFIVPLSVLFYFMYDSTSEDIRAAELELSGNDLEGAMAKLYIGILDSRNTQQERVQGKGLDGPEGIKEVEESFLNVNKLFGDTQIVYDQHAEELLFTDKGLKEHNRDGMTLQNIKSKWMALVPMVRNSETDPKTEAYDDILTDLRTMITHLGDTSGLVLDPRLDSHYLMETTIDSLPQALMRLGRIHRVGAEVVMLNDYSQAQRMDMAGMTRNLRKIDQNDIRFNLESAMSENKRSQEFSESLQNNIPPALAAYDAQVGKLADVLDKMILGDKVSFAEFMGTFDATETNLKNILYTTMNEMDIVIAKRIVDLKSEQRHIIIVCFIFIALSIWLCRYLSKSISAPVYHIKTTLQKLAGGELNLEIEETQHLDEIGEMARAASELKIVSVEALMTKFAVDSVDSSVMIANSKNIVTYVNASLLKLFKMNEAGIRKSMPNFNADNLIGRQIDLFDPEGTSLRRDEILSNSTNSNQMMIDIGDRKFNLTISPIFSPHDKRRLGTAIEWRDMTQELAIQSEIESIVARASAGDLSARADLDGREGFFRSISEGLNNLLDGVSSATNDIIRMLSALADGNLNERITTDYQGAFGQLKNDANATAEKLSQIVVQIQNASELISQAASEISDGSTDLSERTEQQASSLEETAASMHAVSSTVKDNAQSAGEANKLAQEASQIADDGGAVVGNAVKAMSDIETASRKISDIIGVIDEIAFQTNLLALNAAVEAARAGDAGKGFAVVATEVRSLAQRSSQASKEIKELISDSNNMVKNGVDMVNKAGGSLHEIVTSIKRVAELVAGIATASRQQSGSLSEINSAVSQMDEMTQKNAALVEQSAAAAKSMEEQSRDLIDLITFFNFDGQDFDFIAPSPQLTHTPTKISARMAPEKRSSSKKSAGSAKKLSKILAKNVRAGDDWEEF